LGKFSEDLVERDLVQNNFDIIARRFETPFAEVDILAKKKNGLMMIEVKSLNAVNEMTGYLSSAQKRRLFRARIYLESRFKCPASLALAVVSQCGEIHWIYDLND
jgi:Holliday junction resolvase-like predicted endonuclease